MSSLAHFLRIVEPVWLIYFSKFRHHFFFELQTHLLWRPNSLHDRVLVLFRNLNFKLLSIWVVHKARVKPFDEHLDVIFISRRSKKSFKHQMLSWYVSNGSTRNYCQEQFKDIVVGLLVVFKRSVVLDNDWNNKSHHVSQHINRCFTLQLSLANGKQLSSWQIVLLQHIIHNVVNLFSGHWRLNFAKVFIKYFQRFLVNFKFSVSVIFIVDVVSKWCSFTF